MLIPLQRLFRSFMPTVTEKSTMKLDALYHLENYNLPLREVENNRRGEAEDKIREEGNKRGREEEKERGKEEEKKALQEKDP